MGLRGGALPEGLAVPGEEANDGEGVDGAGVGASRADGTALLLGRPRPQDEMGEMLTGFLPLVFCIAGGVGGTAGGGPAALPPFLRGGRDVDVLLLEDVAVLPAEPPPTVLEGPLPTPESSQGLGGSDEVDGVGGAT